MWLHFCVGVLQVIFYNNCWTLRVQLLAYSRVLRHHKNKFLWKNSHSYIRVLWKTLPEESYGRILLEESYVGTPM